MLVAARPVCRLVSGDITHQCQQSWREGKNRFPSPQLLDSLSVKSQRGQKDRTKRFGGFHSECSLMARWRTHDYSTHTTISHCSQHLMIRSEWSHTVYVHCPLHHFKVGDGELCFTDPHPLWAHTSHRGGIPVTSVLSSKTDQIHQFWELLVTVDTEPPSLIKYFYLYTRDGHSG